MSSSIPGSSASSSISRITSSKAIEARLSKSGWRVPDNRISVDVFGEGSRKADWVDKDSRSVCTFGLEGAEIPDESAYSEEPGRRKLFLVRSVREMVVASDPAFDKALRPLPPRTVRM